MCSEVGLCIGAQCPSMHKSTVKWLGLMRNEVQILHIYKIENLKGVRGAHIQVRNSHCSLRQGIITGVYEK